MNYFTYQDNNTHALGICCGIWHAMNNLHFTIIREGIVPVIPDDDVI